MCLGSALVAEALFGPKGPLWLRDRGTANAGGIGVGFAWVWAYFTAGRLARGRHWLRALGEALVPASVLVVVAVWIMRTVAQ